jgi:hypothetical protein
MTQKSLFANQVIEEILREKSNYYTAEVKQKDFWILTSPKFIFEKEIIKQIKDSRFYEIYKEDVKYLTAIVSTDKKYIRWLELRIGYFEDIKNISIYTENQTFEIKQYTSDGIIGSFESDDNSMLLDNNVRIDPSIIAKEYEYINSVLDRY